MSADLEEAVDRDERAMERVASALERLADAAERWCKLAQARFEHDYPAKREPRDAVITRIPTEEDKIKEAQGSTEETTDEWLDIGPREREFLTSPPPPETRRPARRVAKASRVSSIKSKS